MTKKHIFQNLRILVVLIIAVSSVNLLVPNNAQADPTPSCKPPAKLAPSVGGAPPYCQCPTNQVLVTGTPNTCASKCPGNYTSGQQNGQTYCNPPAAATCANGTAPPCNDTSNLTNSGKPKDEPSAHYCGSPNGDYVNTSIDLGCKGQGGPILDLLFAIIRFLSYGVGLIIVGSMTYAGIQYIGSRGDPNATALAIKRIQSNVTALLLFIFAYAIINYVVPGVVLQ